MCSITLLWTRCFKSNKRLDIVKVVKRKASCVVLTYLHFETKLFPQRLTSCSEIKLNIKRLKAPFVGVFPRVKSASSLIENLSALSRAIFKFSFLVLFVPIKKRKITEVRSTLITKLRLPTRNIEIKQHSPTLRPVFNFALLVS